MVTDFEARSGRRLDRFEAVFDDERVVANAGVLLPATLADRLGVEGLVDARKTMTEHPDCRYGQTYFNLLFELRPHLSEQIRATQLDPFGDDRVVPETEAWLMQHWDDPVPEGFVRPSSEELRQNAWNRSWGAWGGDVPYL
jgi:hypothetical protein